MIVNEKEDVPKNEIEVNLMVQKSQELERESREALELQYLNMMSGFPEEYTTGVEGEE